MRQNRPLLILLFAILLCLAGCTPKEAAPVMAPDIPEAAGFRRTVLYYATEDAMMVPLMRQIPWEEGIGKAALGYLVDTPENRAAMDALGLRALIPDGTDIALRIGEEGRARVELSGELHFESEQAQRNMVTAVVNTLSEFPAIQSVQVALNGKQAASAATLPLNVEDAELEVSGSAQPMTLYFPNDSASLNIPVTRYVEKQPTLFDAMQALADGPRAKGLLCCFPEGTRVLDAYMQNGVATVSLSQEYRGVESVDGLGAAGYETMLLTAKSFGDAAALEILIEGEPYVPSVAVSAPLYVNEFPA